MSYKCGFCHGRHTKPETGQQCAKDYCAAKNGGAPLPLRERIASQYGVIGPRERGSKELPSGRYQVDGEVVVVVRRPSSGKWRGRYFVNEVVGGLEKAISDRQERDLLIDLIISVGWAEMLLGYGRKTGLCPICGGSLNHLEMEIGLHLAGTECHATVARYEAINKENVP